MGRVAVRPPGRLLPLLLLLALLSGCAGGGVASASEDEEPQAPLLMEHGCLSMDLDGDGAEEVVRLYALQAADDLPPEALPPEGSDSRNLLFRWYVEAQIGDDLVTCDLNGRYYYYSPQQDQPLFFSIQDRQGASLVVAGLIPQSNGAGAGMLEVHVLSYDKGAFQVLELPLWSIQSVQAGMTAQITVPETGGYLCPAPSRRGYLDGPAAVRTGPVGLDGLSGDPPHLGRRHSRGPGTVF